MLFRSLIAADCGHVEVEADLRIARNTADVHQAVDLDGVVGEAIAHVEVGKRHAVDGVYRLEIEGGIIGIAPEDEGAALAEGEVLLDDILYGDTIGAMGEGVGAEEIERPLIIIGGAQHAVALHGDIVVGATVHQEADGGLGGAVDVEVDEHVR